MTCETVKRITKEAANAGFQTTLIKSCFFLETTDRLTVRAKGAARRQEVARAADVQDEVVRFAIIRRSRPIVAVAADTAQTAVVVVAITRSRIPDGLVRAKLVG